MFGRARRPAQTPSTSCRRIYKPGDYIAFKLVRKFDYATAQRASQARGLFCQQGVQSYFNGLPTDWGTSMRTQSSELVERNVPSSLTLFDG